MINVTRTYLPSLKEYNKYLKTIWSSHWITNNGPLALELEQKLKIYLGVKHLFFVSNGTIALQLAIKALGIRKQILTSPFSFAATTSSIVWEGCAPRFVDIDPNTLCIDTNKIEEAITKDTEAILAVHVYGNPCDVKKIEAIAKRHKLNVIYDAAQAFGVRYDKKSILSYGDISTISFHATKLFHTAEGGAIVTNDDKLAQTIYSMRNFGYDDNDNIVEIGVNAKNSELHAAMGLCVLPKVKSIIKRRKEICGLYSKLLMNTLLQMPAINPNATKNYAYYPVIFPSEKMMLKVKRHLNARKIFPRRYFYPSLNSLNYVEHTSCPVAEDVSKRVLCLPLYPELTNRNIAEIARLVLEKL